MRFLNSLGLQVWLTGGEVEEGPSICKVLGLILGTRKANKTKHCLCQTPDILTLDLWIFFSFLTVSYHVALAALELNV